MKHLSPQTFVNVYTPAYSFYCVRFISFDQKTCCAYFDNNGTTLVVDCQDINALEFPNYCYGVGNPPPNGPAQQNRGNPQ
ncbi:hypothetical protein J2Z23_000013 [Lederbergia galactosidilyticus]|nr:hypothetical protein [Lederbergia galactosidilytica]